MNSILKTTAIALVISSAQIAHAEVEIVARLIETSSDTIVTTDLESLSQVKGVDLLSAPRVTAKSGSKAKIEITKEFKIEGQEAIPIGLDLEITAIEAKKEIGFTAKYKFTEFKGFTEKDQKKTPIFTTVTIPFSGDVISDNPILIELGPKSSIPRRYLHLTIKKV
jgi:hypothetical protein